MATTEDSLETLEGYVEDRDPDTEVLMKKTSGGRRRTYHEIPIHYERGDSPPCGSHCNLEKAAQYVPITLEAAIRKWAEPCGHDECEELRMAEGEYPEPYMNPEVLHEKFWVEGKTQHEIAADFDVDDSTIRRWMSRGDVPTSVEEYEKKHDQLPDYE